VILQRVQKQWHCSITGADMAIPLIFGILNVTPDSFSDGGKYTSVQRAVEHAHQMIAAGADVIDIGGESTRPGAAQITLDEEQSRVLPVIEQLVKENIVVSLDTMRADTARHGINLGVRYINDVSGGKADAEMLNLVAKSDVDYILMHWRGHSDVMNSLATYDNVTRDVIAEIEAQRIAAVASGINTERIINDPGFGFAKDAEHNWQLLRDLSDITSLPHRVLVGVSRKRFLSSTVQPALASDSEARDAATAAISLYSALHGAWAVRVHDVASTFSALRVADEIGSSDNE
jgi:dihydropteroate synthase